MDTDKRHVVFIVVLVELHRMPRGLRGGYQLGFLGRGWCEMVAAIGRAERAKTPVPLLDWRIGQPWAILDANPGVCWNANRMSGI